MFDLTVATLCIGGAKELMDSIRQIMDIRLNIKIVSDAVILSVFASLVSWISIVVIADMAVILSASVLAGKKGSGIAAFALFLILSWLFSQMLNLVPAFDNMNLTMILENRSISGTECDFLLYQRMDHGKETERLKQKNDRLTFISWHRRIVTEQKAFY